MLNNAQREYINKNKHRMAPAKAVIIVLTVLGGLVFAGYYPSLHNRYAFDDISTIEDNKFIRSWGNVKGLLNNEYFKESGELSYRPLVTLTYFFDYALFKSNPSGYHFHSLIWHALVSILLFVTALRLKFSWPWALLASTLFAVHPVNTEAVNCIAFREDILCAFFYLAAFLAYHACLNTDRPSLRWIAGLFGAVFLSLSAKEMGLSFIAVAFLYYFATRRDRGGGSLKAFVLRPDTIAVFLATLIFGILRFIIFNNGNAEIVEYIGDGFWSNLRTLFVNYARFFQMMIWPHPLSIVYLIEPVHHISDARFLASLLGLALLFAWAWRMRSAMPLGAYAIVAIFLVLLPVSNLIPIRHPVAERYLYLPNALFCLLITGFISRLPRIDKNQKYVYASVIGILVSIMLVRTHLRAYDWRDNFSLWSKTVKTVPLSSKAHYSLGHAWQTLKSNLPFAIEEYERARGLDPKDSWIRINLGMAYKDIGEYKKAEAEFLEGLQIDPKSALLFYDLGILYGRMGDHVREEDAYRSAIKADETYGDAYDNLAVLLAERGNESAARELWEKAVKIDPPHARSHFNLGNYYANHGDMTKAAALWRRTLELDPDHQGARARLLTIEKLKD